MPDDNLSMSAHAGALASHHRPAFEFAEGLFVERPRWVMKAPISESRTRRIPGGVIGASERRAG